MVNQGWNTKQRGSCSGKQREKEGDRVHSYEGKYGVKGRQLHMSNVQTFANLNIAIIMICIIII